jgi:hypothetical protein
MMRFFCRTYMTLFFGIFNVAWLYLGFIAQGAASGQILRASSGCAGALRRFGGVVFRIVELRVSALGAQP